MSVLFLFLIIVAESFFGVWLGYKVGGAIKLKIGRLPKKGEKK